MFWNENRIGVKPRYYSEAFHTVTTQLLLEEMQIIVQIEW